MAKQNRKPVMCHHVFAVTYWFVVYWLVTSIYFLRHSGLGVVFPSLAGSDFQLEVGFPLVFYTEGGFAGAIDFDYTNAIADLTFAVIFALGFGLCTVWLFRGRLSRNLPLRGLFGISDIIIAVLGYSVLLSVFAASEHLSNLFAAAIVPILPAFGITSFYLTRRKVFLPIAILSMSLFLLPKMFGFENSDNLMRVFAVWPFQLFCFLQFEAIKMYGSHERTRNYTSVNQ